MEVSEKQGVWYAIVNIFAASKKASGKWMKAEEKLKSDGVRYVEARTGHHGNAMSLTREACADGYRKFIAVGGDGTVHDVLEGIMFYLETAGPEVSLSDFTLAVIPVGSGNDWIKTANIPTNTNDAINIICNGNTSLQDVGRATYHINGSKHIRYFVNTAGSGLDSIVINKVSPKKANSKKKGTNKLVYILTLLAEFTKYKPVEVTLEADNNTTLKGNMLNFAIGIGKYNGGGMLPFPNANTGNNLFEVLFISNMPKIRMLFVVPKLFSGTLEKVKEVKYIRSKKIKLSSATPIFAETDGEVIGYTPILFDIEPLAFCYFSK